MVATGRLTDTRVPQLVPDLPRDRPVAILPRDRPVAIFSRHAEPCAILTLNALRRQLFCAPPETIPFDQISAKHYADIRYDLEATGTPIGPNDLLIAATARARHLTLITHNTNEFRRVTGLAIEDWCC